VAEDRDRVADRYRDRAKHDAGRRDQDDRQQPQSAKPQRPLAQLLQPRHSVQRGILRDDGRAHGVGEALVPVQ
jgi:hypothetical protein